MSPLTRAASKFILAVSCFWSVGLPARGLGAPAPASDAQTVLEEAIILAESSRLPRGEVALQLVLIAEVQAEIDRRATARRTAARALGYVYAGSGDRGEQGAARLALLFARLDQPSRAREAVERGELTGLAACEAYVEIAAAEARAGMADRVPPCL